MRSLQFDTAAFINEYHQARDAGLTQKELAALMGITYTCFNGRKHALKKRGIRLPALPRSRSPGSGRRKAARTVAKLIAPVECHVEQAPLTFTMHVGVFDA